MILQEPSELPTSTLITACVAHRALNEQAVHTADGVQVSVAARPAPTLLPAHPAASLARMIMVGMAWIGRRPTQLK